MAKSINVDILSPIDGFNVNDPANGVATVTTTGYIQFTTKGMVDEAHSLQLKVIPWTVNDKPTMTQLLKEGVDGIISNYPLDVQDVAKSLGYLIKAPVPFNPQCKLV